MSAKSTEDPRYETPPTRKDHTHVTAEKKESHKYKTIEKTEIHEYMTVQTTTISVDLSGKDDSGGEEHVYVAMV